MVFRMELRYHEHQEILDTKFNGAKTDGSTLTPGIKEIGDSNSMLKSLLPNEVRVYITIDDSKLRANLTNL